MSEAGHGLQIVNVTESHSYELDVEKLEGLLLREDIRDLPVVVVSVAGAYRGGKSFLLNFFIRYLTSTLSAREDGSWLGEDSEPLVGFQWRSGIKATTMGVMMWSEPFIAELPSGEQVAVLLVDTQGTFDTKSTFRDNSTVFALSTLLSSVQIYNLSHDIKEDDLQHLELFTEYGKMVNAGDSKTKAFQLLEFLIRDWQFPEDYPFGTVGGEKLLEEKLRVSRDLAKEMQELRQHIRSSFKQVSCFLLPHPGFEVLKSTYSGSISEIDPDFRVHLENFVNSIFSPEKLLPKTINGVQVTAGDLFNYFKIYMELFNSDKIPTPTTIMAATVKAGFLAAMSGAQEIYERGMSAECGPKALSVPAGDLEFLHKKYLALAQTTFTNKKKLGSKEEAERYLKQLTKTLEDRLPQYLLSNQSKILTAINEAKDAYDGAVQSFSRGELLCVHPSDLANVHKAGTEAAIKTFDASRKRVTDKYDEERAKFIKSLEQELQLLQRENDRNNGVAVNEVWMEYWKHMQIKAIEKPPLTQEQLEDEHSATEDKVLKNFELKRNMPNHYSEDVYKFNLTKEIQDSFTFLKSLHESKNKEAMRSAIEEYDRYMEGHWSDPTQSMHPNDLEEAHRVAICRALTTYRPNKECSDGFNYANTDESTLYQVINQRHQRYIKSNEKANEATIAQSLNAYIKSMEALSGFSASWLLLVPYILRNMNLPKYHDESKNKAYAVFFANRRDNTYTSSDPFYERLNKEIDNYYREHYGTQDWSSLRPYISTIQAAQGSAGPAGGEAGVLQAVLGSLQKENTDQNNPDVSWLQTIMTALKKE